MIGNFPDEKKKKAKNCVRKKSQKQEKKIAKVFGGTPTKGSRGGDVKIDDFFPEKVLVEAKITSKSSISIKKAWIEKICSEARLKYRVPAFCFGFSEENPKLSNENWIAFRIEDLKKLMPKLLDEKICGE